MRLACLALFALSAIHAQTNMLEPYVGRDLWKQGLSDEDRQSLKRIVGSVPKGFITEPVPWYVWKTMSTGESQYIVLLAEPLLSIPGGSSACVRLVDSGNRRVNSWSFQVGWRTSLKEASIEYSPELRSDLIVIRLVPVINGRNIAKVYFALQNDRLRFIRLENDQGVLVQNEYLRPNFEIGLKPESTSVEKWAALLESSDKADALSALVFLGGKHTNEPESKYVDLYLKLSGNARIRQAIENLTKSDNNWVSQAALLAKHW